MSDKYCIKIIHDCLQSKDKWYIDFNCTDECYVQDVCSQAKEYADERLPKLSMNALYSRYRDWRKSEMIIPTGEGYFQAFLSQVCFDLGIQALKGEDKIIFNQHCSFTHRFIS